MIRFEGTLTPDLLRRAFAANGRSTKLVAWMLILVAAVNFRFANLWQPVSWAMPLFIATFGVTLLLSMVLAFGATLLVPVRARVHTRVPA